MSLASNAYTDLQNLALETDFVEQMYVSIKIPYAQDCTKIRTAIQPFSILSAHQKMTVQHAKNKFKNSINTGHLITWIQNSPYFWQACDSDTIISEEISQMVLNMNYTHQSVSTSGRCFWIS
jgi:beta-lactamase class D